MRRTYLFATIAALTFHLHAQAGVVNECGGFTVLANPPGDPCGVCSLDEYVCIGPDETACNGNTAANACGGCTALANPPGSACGPSGMDVYVCDGAESTVCNTSAGPVPVRPWLSAVGAALLIGLIGLRGAPRVHAARPVARGSGGRARS